MSDVNQPVSEPTPEPQPRPDNGPDSDWPALSHDDTVEESDDLAPIPDDDEEEEEEEEPTEAVFRAATDHDIVSETENRRR